MVRAQLEELAQLAPWWRGYGMALAATASERVGHRAAMQEVVPKFEEEHQIRLPEEYRGLLLGVGDCAPLPGQARGGLLPLHSALCATTASDLLGRLCIPFSHYGNDDVSLPWDDELDDYCERPPLQGVLPIADGGCDVSFLLVVTGPDRGMVWAFAASGEPELQPTGLGFLAWYTGRLDAGLAPLRAERDKRDAWAARVAADPSDAEAAVALGRDLLLVDEPRAAELIERAWALGEVPEACRGARLRAVAELDLLQGRFDRIATMESEDDGCLRCYAGVAAALERDWVRSDALLSCATKLPFGLRILAAYCRGRALAGLGQEQAALDLLRASPSSARSYELIAELQAELGESGRSLRLPDPSVRTRARPPERPTVASYLLSKL